MKRGKDKGPRKPTLAAPHGTLSFSLSLSLPNLFFFIKMPCGGGGAARWRRWLKGIVKEGKIAGRTWRGGPSDL